MTPCCPTYPSRCEQPFSSTSFEVHRKARFFDIVEKVVAARSAADVAHDFRSKVPYKVDHDGAPTDIVEKRRQALAAMKEEDQHMVDRKLQADYDSMVSSLPPHMRSILSDKAFEVHRKASFF